MRSKKALLNIITKFLYQIVALVTGLVTPRLILQTFGSSYNGAIASIGQFLGMVSILTLGIAGAMRVELYKTLATKDTLGTSRIVRATEKCFQKIGYALIIYTVFLAIVFPIVLRGQIPAVDAFLLVFIIAIATFGQYYFGQTYYLLLQADQSDYIVTSVHIVVNIVNMLLAVLLIYLNASIIIVKLGSSLLFLLYPFIVSKFVRRKYGLVKDCDGDPSLLKQRGSAMFHSIANIIHDNTDILFLTFFTDTLTMSVYTVYYIIVKNIKQIMQNFTTGLEGAFGNMWVNGETSLFCKNFKTYEFLSYAFSSVVFTSTGILLLPFVGLYTKGITDINYVRLGLAILITVTEGIFCLRQPYVTIVQAVGKYKETKNGAMVEAVVNILISLILVNVIGLNGVIIGTLVANVFRTFQYAFYTSRELLHSSIFHFFGKLLWHIGNTAVILLIYSFISPYLIINSWGTWIVVAMIVFAISMFVTVLSAMIFYRKDLMNAWNFMMRMLRRKKAV